MVDNKLSSQKTTETATKTKENNSFNKQLYECASVNTDDTYRYSSSSSRGITGGSWSSKNIDMQDYLDDARVIRLGIFR